MAAATLRAGLRTMFVAAMCASGWASTPVLNRVEAPPALTPLAMHVGGRALRIVEAAGDGFGPEDTVSQWPGSYFEAAFKGPEVFFRVGKAHEILHVAVDGQTALVLPDPQPGVYRVSGLDDTAHRVRVEVVTESQSEPNHFGGFAIAAGATALTPKSRQRQMEFIGDSHTVGYGNTSATHDCTPEAVWVTTDDSQAFGPLTASHYDADYQVNAISGRGVVRNYNGFAADTLPEAYPYVLLDKKQVYSDPSWKPQVIVIALGTNDFSTPLNAGERWKSRDELHADYEATYVRFLEGAAGEESGRVHDFVGYRSGRWGDRVGGAARRGPDEGEG